MLSLFKLIALLLVQSAVFSIPTAVTYNVKTKFGTYQGEAVPGYTNIVDWKVKNEVI